MKNNTWAVTTLINRQKELTYVVDDPRNPFCGWIFKYFTNKKKANKLASFLNKRNVSRLSENKVMEELLAIFKDETGIEYKEPYWK